jgi:exosome complex component RRP42
MAEKRIISNLQREKIFNSLKEGKRIDGRAPEEFREIKVEEGISMNAESAVSVKIGKTEVYCGVKCALTEPYPDSPKAGNFMVSAELHPMADNYFASGKPSIDAVELSRVTDRGIRESGFIDFEGLCIKEGEKVWQVFVDIVVINYDGNLFDAASLGSLIALGRAKLPVYDEKEDKLEHKLSDKPLPLNKESLSFNMTIHKIGNTFIVDPSLEEEVISDARLSVAFADNEGKVRITALQKGKEGTLSSEDMEKILNLVESKFTDLFPKVRNLVWNEKE